MANINDNILEAIEILVDSKINQVAFDRTIICKVTNDKKAEDGEYQVSYQNSKFTAYSIGDTKYNNNQNVYVLIKNGDFSQEKIIIGAQRTTDTSPYFYSLPGDRVVKATSNLCSIDNNEINVVLPSNYEYNLGYKIKYILLSADFTNTDPDNFTGDYTLSLSINDNLYGGLLSSQFYGNPQYADSLNQEILLDMPDIDITKIELIPGIEKGYTIGTTDSSTIKIENIQLYLCYDKNDIPVVGEAISLYTNDKNQNYEYNSNDQANSLQSVDFYAKILYNQNVVNIDDNKNEYLAETDELVWFKYQLGYSSKITDNDQLKWESLAGTNWSYQGNKKAIDNLDQDISLFTANMDFNMATTQYKVIWFSQEKIINKDGNEIINWVSRAQDGVSFNNIARVVDETTAEAGAAGNSRISLQINNDNNSNFFVYGNDMEAVGDNHFNIIPYFNDGTSVTSGTISLYFPQANSSQINTPISDKDENNNDIGKVTNNGVIWDIFIEDNYTVLITSYTDKLPIYNATFNRTNYSRSNNTIKCKIEQNNDTYFVSRMLNFGYQNTAGTGYKLNIIPEGNDAFILPIDGNSEETITTIKYHVTLEDFYGNLIKGIYDQIKVQVNQAPLIGNYIGHAITVYENYALIQVSVTSVTTVQNQAGIITVTLTTNLGEELGMISLRAVYPIIYKSSNKYKYITGATRVIYNSLNVLSTYDKTPYSLYQENEDGTIELVDLSTDQWHISYYGTLSSSKNNLPAILKINNNQVLLEPVSSYMSNFPAIYIYVQDNENNILWCQPIIIEQNQYFSETLNNWNGSTFTDDSIILSQMIGAGSKNTNNQFSGVLMGKATTKDFNKNTITAIGLYGFSNGALRFKFDENGNAYIGKDNNYIDFTNGNLDIRSQQFTLDANYMTISSNNQQINIYNNRDNNISSLRVKLGLITGATYGLDIYQGAFRLYGKSYSPYLTDKDAVIYFDGENMTISGELIKKYQSNYGDKIWEDQIGLGKTIQEEYMGQSWIVHKGIMIEHQKPLQEYNDWQDQYGGVFIGIESFDESKQGIDRFDRSVVMGTGKELVLTNSPKYPYSFSNSYDSSIEIYPKTPLMTSTSSRPYINLNTSSSTNTHRITVSVKEGSSSSRIAIYGTLEQDNATFTLSDMTLKNSIGYIFDEYNILFDQLVPRIYKYNDGTSNRNHIGFIAQEVLEGLSVANINLNDFAALGKIESETETEHWALRYEEFIALNTWQIQKLKARVNELENKIAQLEQNK